MFVWLPRTLEIIYSISIVRPDQRSTHSCLHQARMMEVIGYLGPCKHMNVPNGWVSCFCSNKVLIFWGSQRLVLLSGKISTTFVGYFKAGSAT